MRLVRLCGVQDTRLQTPHGSRYKRDRTWEESGQSGSEEDEDEEGSGSGSPGEEPEEEGE